MTQGERLRRLRKEELHLTLDRFGEKVGVGKSAISEIESGRNNLTGQMARAICREFNVNEKWLLTGEGDIFVRMDLEDEIAALIGQISNEPDASFKKKLLAVLANLSEEQWELLADLAEKLAEK
jgi:transcriptional regulator with XRE-family HTH domain